ncbi:JAB domain-containing protein [Lysobacter firmicutimachus]|uniref:JAB domain-containing protein n=1 Tax=Lysobacter firmicutimachus TaxID=1792846 RepID=A0AAU8MWM0_9GAMM
MYFAQRLRGLQHEVFAAVLTAAPGDRLEELPGHVDGAEMHPREVVRRALQRNAAVVSWVTHPSGVPSPRADAGHRPAAPCRPGRCAPAGSLVVGTVDPVSMAERGWM